MTAPDPAARSALLRRLLRDGFVPPEADAPWSTAARGAAFATEVEAFAAAFWSLTVDVRRARYDALWERRVGPAAARLAELGNGLEVLPLKSNEPKQDALAQLARELFILPVRSRAARRAAWFAEIEPNHDSWIPAARAVAFADPLGARLDLSLFAKFSIRLLPLPVNSSVVPKSAPIRSASTDADRDTRNAWFITKVGFVVIALMLAFYTAGGLGVLGSLLIKR